MARIKSLNLYQKCVLLFIAAMLLVFTVVYPIIISRVGFSYQNTILIPSQENDSTVYSGKIKGNPARFTVSADKTVMFQYGDKTYGPYTAREDPTAIPKDQDLAEHMTGVELLHGEEIFFRGGVLDLGENRCLYNEDGSPNMFYISVAISGENTMMDENGNIIDPMEPSAAVILDLMADPELTHKGTWMGWFFGVFICMGTAIFILFADELFLLHLALRVRNTEGAEPSDWEIAGRYVSWTVLPIMALVLFVMGLK